MGRLQRERHAAAAHIMKLNEALSQLHIEQETNLIPLKQMNSIPSKGTPENPSWEMYAPVSSHVILSGGIKDIHVPLPDELTAALLRRYGEK